MMIIAETRLFCETEDSSFDIDIELYQPVQTEHGDYSTKVKLTGLLSVEPDISGEGSFQSLMLAISFIKKMISDKRGQGHKFHFKFDDELHPFTQPEEIWGDIFKLS